MSHIDANIRLAGPVPCAICGHSARTLPPYESVEYFYCDHCGTGWKVDPDDTAHAPIIMSTVMRAQPAAQRAMMQRE